MAFIGKRLEPLTVARDVDIKSAFTYINEV